MHFSATMEDQHSGFTRIKSNYGYYSCRDCRDPRPARPGSNEPRTGSRKDQNARRCKCHGGVDYACTCSTCLHPWLRTTSTPEQRRPMATHGGCRGSTLQPSIQASAASLLASLLAASLLLSVLSLESMMLRRPRPCLAAIGLGATTRVSV